MDIAQAIIDSVNEMGQSGKLQEIIASSTTKCVEKIVGDLFEWGGPVKKTLETHIKASSELNPRMITLPNLQVLVAQQAAEAYSDAITKLGLDKTRKLVADMLGVTEGPLKLSELVKIAKEEIDKDDASWGDEISLHVKQSEYCKDDFHVYLDPKPDAEKYSCRVQMFIANGRISRAELSGTEYTQSFSSKTKQKLVLGIPDKLENVLIHAYTTQREIVMDEGNCDLRIHEED